MWPVASESHFLMDGPFLLPGQTAQVLGGAVLLPASFLQPGFLT